MELSVFDLSKHLGVLPDTIERWVRQGKLPVSREGANYRFRSSELGKWASKNNINLDLSDIARPETRLEKQDESDIPLSEAIQNGGIYFDVQGNDVKSVLTACIEKNVKIPDDFKPDLLGRLIKREQALSTGIGNGIAIPHPREQLANLSHPMVSICFLANPVDYRALDKKPVIILFLLLSPSLKIHLHLLSALSFCLRDNEFVRFIKSNPDPEELLAKVEILQASNSI